MMQPFHNACGSNQTWPRKSKTKDSMSPPMKQKAAIHQANIEEAKPKVDEAGIEPATLCMLSTRATNCATRPFDQHIHKWNFLHSILDKNINYIFVLFFYSNIFMRVPFARWRHALARSFRLALLRLALLARSSVVRWKWKFEETQQCSLLLSLVAK